MGQISIRIQNKIAWVCVCIMTSDVPHTVAYIFTFYFFCPDQKNQKKKKCEHAPVNVV